MDKQELLEYIAPYLPYNVKAQLYFNGKKQHQVVNSNKTLDLRTVAFYIENYDHIGFKIILHPLSDLTKPCLEWSKIPFEELKKFYPSESIGLNPATWSYRSVQWLYKHHFDIHNLIGRGYAIDINTLNSSKVE